MKSIHKFSIFLVSLLVSYQSLAMSSTLTGMQLGDDAAQLTIVEYRSLTCSHCADFSNNIFPEIKEKYIDTGKIKFEVRPFALNAIDLNAFKLLHCADEKDFFAMEKLLFQDQKKWIVTKQSDRVLENSTDALRTYSTLFSISEDEFNSCMENEEITDFILTMRIDAVEDYDVSSTPSFIIDGDLYSGNMSFSEFEKIIEKKIN